MSLKSDLLAKSLKHYMVATVFTTVAIFLFRLFIAFSQSTFVSSELVRGLYLDFLCAYVLYLPILSLIVCIHFFASTRVSNLLNYILRVYFILLNALVIFYLVGVEYFRRGEFGLSLIQEILEQRELIELLSIERVLVLCFLFFVLVLFSSYIFKRHYRKRRSILSGSFLSYCLLAIAFLCSSTFFVYEFESRSFDVLDRKKEFLTWIDLYRDREKKNWKKGFESYLGLDLRYEKESNLIELLTRRTSEKSDEASVVVLSFTQIKKTKFQALIKDKNNYYTFKRALTSSFERELAFDSIEFNLPMTRSFKSKRKFLTDEESLKTYSLSPFDGFSKSIYRHCSSERVLDVLERTDSLDRRAYLFQVTDDEKLDDILDYIESRGNIIVAITSSRKNAPVDDSLAKKFLNRSTFLSFYIPYRYKPASFNENKIVGQEDIMPSLYNLALNDRPYTSLGDDLFLDANSNAINEELFADQNGAWIGNKFYSWKRGVHSLEEDRSFLKQRYEATNSIVHFIILDAVY